MWYCKNSSSTSLGVLLTEEKLLLPVNSLAAAPDMDPDDSKQLTLQARTRQKHTR